MANIAVSLVIDQPLTIFVQRTLQDRDCVTIIDNWPVSVENIAIMANKHFFDLGISRIVTISQGALLKRQLIMFLKYSPQLRRKVDQAKKAAEAAANKNKNAFR